MRNKLVKRCKKCHELFDVYFTYQAPQDIRYYLEGKMKLETCARCTILSIYKKQPLRKHDWRIHVAASREKWIGVR